MEHHVLHVSRDARIPVLVDLASAPGRTLVFTRTKSGAAHLARKLTAAGVPAVDMHGNLSQGARTRNLKAFSDGSAQTMVATDIAARGIHVDDIGLVVHADPPVEHKAYLHRSGRTARAGAAGTVVTLMTDAQVSDVRTLTRRAGIKPTITRAVVGHPVLAEIAPGERTLIAHAALPRLADAGRQPGRRRSSNGRDRSTRGGSAQTAGGRKPRRRSSAEPNSTSRGRSHEVGSSAAAFSGGIRSRRGR
jgi:superfamily II DNA/RNA helicase